MQTKSKNANENGIQSGLSNGLDGFKSPETGVRRIEEDLSRFEFIVNASRDLISFVDTNYVYRAINLTYQRTYGRDKTQIIGAKVPDVWSLQTFEAFIRPKFDRCFEGHEVRDQALIKCGSRGSRFMDITYLPYTSPDGSIRGAGVTSHDITELKMAQEEILQSETRYRKLVESSSDFIVSMDGDGDYTFLNPAARSVFKEKKNYLIYVYKEDLEKTRSAWDELSSGNDIRDFENRILSPDGKLLNVSWKLSPQRDAQERLVGCIAIGRDISTNRRLETLAAEAGLTPRETEIVSLVVQGYTNLNIAARLSISEATVKFHLNSVFLKTKVHNRTELAAHLR